MGRIRKLPLEDVVPSPSQPRRHFDEAKLTELAESIKQVGLLQPILVRPSGGKYEVVHGERRYRACKLADKETIRAEVRELSDREVVEIQLIENLQRENLNSIEEAETFRRLVEDFGYTHKYVGQRVGKSREYVTNKLRLLKLPSQVQKRVREGLLSEGHAKAILSLERAVEQEEAARKVVEKGLRVREAEQLVREFKADVPRGTFSDNEPKHVRMVEVDQLEVFKLTHSHEAVPLDRLIRAYVEDFKRLRRMI